MMSNPPSGLVATDEMLVEISQKIARLEKLLRLARECDFQDAQREIQASLRDACTCDTRRSPREGPRDRAAKPVLSSRRGRRTSRSAGGARRFPCEVGAMELTEAERRSSQWARHSRRRSSRKARSRSRRLGTARAVAIRTRHRAVS